MTQPPAFLQQRMQIDPRMTFRGWKIKGRRRHRKAWRIDFKMRLNHLIRHLIVPPAADAVHKLVG